LLTQDHAVVEEAVRQGRLSPEEALSHPLRHVLTRALGAEADVEPDLAVHSLQPDDLVLLCTDGLTKMLNDEEILDTVLRTKTSPGTEGPALVQEANRRGGDDNVTVVIIRNGLTK
jgi:protein phosphatase